ncbi:MAG: LPP20 family lipoprotein [Candidatus Delongbacteria bacterium]|nr:LPP20 family lipoprotein [Candidatus Delongbacteria bacterium]
MKKNISNIVIIFLVLGCSQTKQINNEIKVPVIEKEKKIEKAIPEWISNPPQPDEYYIYGTGIGKNYDSSDNAAKSAISRYFKDKLESEYREYSQSITVDGREYYDEYIDNRVKSYSRMNLPGVTIEQRHDDGKNYYSLARLDISILHKYHLGIESRIDAYIQSAKKEMNPGTKMLLYFQAASLLPKCIFPVYVKEEPIFIFLQGEISDLKKTVNILYSISERSDFIDDKTLIINLNSEGRNLRGLPLIFNSSSSSSTEEGFYFFRLSDLTERKSFTLDIKIDPERLTYPPDLDEYERNVAIKTVENIFGGSWNVRIEVPLELKVFIDEIVYINNKILELSQCKNKITNIINSKGYQLLNDSSDADVKIQISINIFESSYSEYLGYCYKTTGTLSIQNSNWEDKRFYNYDSVEIEEKTKSFHSNQDSASREAYRKFCDIIYNDFKELEF